MPRAEAAPPSDAVMCDAPPPSYETVVTEAAADKQTGNGDRREQIAAPVVIEGPAQPEDPLGVFGRYLTLWVALAMVFGILVGEYIPSIPDGLAEAEVGCRMKFSRRRWSEASLSRRCWLTRGIFRPVVVTVRFPMYHCPLLL